MSHTVAACAEDVVLIVAYLAGAAYAGDVVLVAACFTLLLPMLKMLP